MFGDYEMSKEIFGENSANIEAINNPNQNMLISTDLVCEIIASRRRQIKLLEKIRMSLDENVYKLSPEGRNFLREIDEVIR